MSKRSFNYIPKLSRIAVSSTSFQSMKVRLQLLLGGENEKEKQKMSSLRSVFHQLAPFYNKGVVGSPDTLGSLDLDNASGFLRTCKMECITCNM